MTLLCLTVAGGVRPADAHGTGRHTIRVMGRMTMTDKDDFLNGGDENCDIGFNEQKDLQAKKEGDRPSVLFDIDRRCDEVAGIIRLTVKVRTDRFVDTSGFVKASERDCFFSCGSITIGEQPFKMRVAENTFGHYGPWTFENAYGRVTIEFTVVAST